MKKCFKILYLSLGNGYDSIQGTTSIASTVESFNNVYRKASLLKFKLPEKYNIHKAAIQWKTLKIAIF